MSSLYKFPFNLYCGDSAYYLYLAENLNMAAADRPSGYPMFLSLFLSSLFRNWRLIPFVQIFFSLMTLVFSLFLVIKQKNSIRYILFFVITYFNFHTIFMERSIMPDSIAFNLLSISLLLSLSKYSKYSIIKIIIGIFIGLLPLLRTNYLVFSYLILFVLFIKEYNLIKNIKRTFIKSTLSFIPFLLIVFIYNNLFVFPRLGVRKLSSFGGRTLFSRVMYFSNCESVVNESKNNLIFSKSIDKYCNFSDKSSYSKILWSENGLILLADKEINQDRALSDKYYLNVSMKLILKNPLLIFKILNESINDLFNANDIFYLRNYFPHMLGGCESLPSRFGFDINYYTESNSSNQKENLVVLLAKSSTILQKLIVILFFLYIPIFFLKKKLENNFRKVDFIYVSIYLATALYFLASLIFAGFDYRYIQPLWLILPLILFIK